jgi:hypothetical protein
LIQTNLTNDYPSLPILTFYAARIEMRAQDVTQLRDMPTPFLTQAAAQAALDSPAVALVPSGFLVVGLRPRRQIRLGRLSLVYGWSAVAAICGQRGDGS